jgi:chemotaxis methyl-accepting protein methylase
MSRRSADGVHDDVDRAVDRAVELLDARIGMRADRSFRVRLRRCVVDEARGRAVDTHEYVTRLERDPPTLQQLLNRVTVQETGFFRHPLQFEVLARDVLPAVRKPVTIWSAACSNGQEAYTIAMVLEEQGVPGTVIATDISTLALERTGAAEYSERELSGLSPERRALFLAPAKSGGTIVPAVRDRVQTARHNLLDPVPDVVRSCQIVFCRNVLIYFSSERSGAFLGQLADRMPSDGYLFVGSAETLWQLTDRFQPLGLGTEFVYRPGPPMPGVRASTTIAREPATPPHPRPRAQPTPKREQTRLAAVHRQSAATAADLEREGLAQLRNGEHAAAIATFRKWAYLQPDDVMAHVNLGLALERAGESAPARTAYMSARAAMRDTEAAALEEALGGYHVEELSRLLDLKIGANG